MGSRGVAADEEPRDRAEIALGFYPLTPRI